MTTTTTPQAEALGDDLRVQGERVLGAYRAEVRAVAKQPTRPLLFALGVADRTVGAARELPSVLTPSRARRRAVATARRVGDLAERAQRGYTEVAKDGEGLVRAVRGQDATQEAGRLAERAVTQTKQAARAAGKSAESTLEAVRDGAATLG